MKKYNIKIISIIIIMLVFTSIFLFGYNRYDANSKDIVSISPCFESYFQEQYLFQNSGSLQFPRSNKNIVLSLNMKYILFKIIIFASLFKIINLDVVGKLLKINKFSVFIVLFINKKDGKKRKLNYLFHN